MGMWSRLPSTQAYHEPRTLSGQPTLGSRYIQATFSVLYSICVNGTRQGGGGRAGSSHTWYSVPAFLSS